MGSTLKDLRFRQRYNATVLGIRRGQELIRDRSCLPSRLQLLTVS